MGSKSENKDETFGEIFVLDGKRTPLHQGVGTHDPKRAKVLIALTRHLGSFPEIGNLDIVSVFFYTEIE
jgi:hypothetical protein